MTGPLTLEFAAGSGAPTIADFTAIQGQWTIVSQVKDGGFLLEQQRGKWIEFDKDIMRFDVSETPPYQPFLPETRFVIDSATAPRHFDIVGIGANGIYRLKEVLHKPDEWFTLEVIARAERIVMQVNGQTTVDFVDANRSFRRGHFALQVWPAETVVRFRKIEVKERSATGR